MRSAVLVGPGRFELVERPMPEVTEQNALVRVRAVGICGTDIHGYRGAFPWMTYPTVLGHEIAGEVVGIGSGVDASLLGKKVCVEPTITCGQCYPCRVGRSNCCVKMKVRGVHTDGALSEFISIPADHLYPLPDSFGYDEGALVEPLAIGRQAVWRGSVEPEDTVAIIGAGPIGLSCLLAAKDAGARVVIADLVDSRLSIAEAYSADIVVNSRRHSLSDAVSNFTGGDGASVVIDAVGAPATLNTAAEIVSSAGRLVILGFGEEPLGIGVPLIIRKELDIRGSRLNTGQFPRAIALAQKRHEDIRKLVSHRFPIDQVDEAMELASSHPDQTCKVLVTLG